MCGHTYILLQYGTATWWQFKPRPFDRTNKAVGPGKNPKLINVGPTFIPDYRLDSYFV